MDLNNVECVDAVGVSPSLELGFKRGGHVIPHAMPHPLQKQYPPSGASSLCIHTVFLEMGESPFLSL